MDWINMKTNQTFLGMIYALQNNKSNAVLTPKELSIKLFPFTVYTAYDYTKSVRLYALQPIENILQAEAKPHDKGGRPRSLTDDQIREIAADSRSNMELAGIYKVAESTIRNAKKIFANRQNNT